MNIMFVRPAPVAETIGLQHIMVVEPLELEVLAGLIGPDDSAVIIDMLLEKNNLVHYLKKHRPDILCLTGYITQVPVIKAHARSAKEYSRHIITVVGGVHCEVCPGDFEDPGIDYRVVRNATRVFPLLLANLRAGRSGPDGCPHGVLYRSGNIEENMLPTMEFYFPLPDRTLTKRYRKRYFYVFHDKVALIKTAFGCPHKCTFCFCRKITHDTYATRPMGDVVNELLSIAETEIYIVDDDFFASKQRLEEFLDAIETCSVKKSYLVYGRADFIAENPSLIRRFKINGLRTVIVGLESFFDDELNGYHKNSNCATNTRALEILNANQIDCFATVIIPPAWDKRRFYRAGEILRSLGIHYVNLQPLTPLPGTDIAADPDRLLIKRDEYEKWDLAHVSIMPEHMNVSQFYREILHLYDRILFRPSVMIMYLKTYKPLQLWKMIIGTVKVRQQYMDKIKQAKKAEKKRDA